MQRTTLAPAVLAHVKDLQVRVAEVHVSANVRTSDFDEAGRVVVALQLSADAPTRLDLRRAKLGFTDFEGHEEWRTALASGIGAAPSALRDNLQADVLQLEPGVPVEVWIGFGQFKPRSYPELAQRLQLVLTPGERITLSEPGKLPVWKGEPITTSNGFAISGHVGHGYTSFNVTLSDARFMVGPLVFDAALGIGVLGEQYADTRPCCEITYDAGLSWPLALSSRVALAPYAGVDLAFSSLSGSDRRWRIGPALGVELSMNPLRAQRGPFPIDYPRSALSNYNVRFAVVEWFGSEPGHGGDLPSLGLIVTTGYAFTFGQ